MTDKKEERRKALYNEIRKLIDSQSYGKIVKICNKILSENCNDVKAWQCKMNACIKLGNFSEALQSLKTCKDLQPILFEKAYCEYRINDCATAYKTLSQVTDKKSPKFKELNAQILYRMERYDEAFTIYRDLYKNLSDSYDEERLANLMAVVVNKRFNGSTEGVPDIGVEDSYNQMFNKACGLITSSDFSKALQILRQAKRICTKVMEEEGFSQDEIHKDVASFRVQEAYCLQCMGQEKEAMSIYNAVLKTKPDDPALIAIISTNIVAINKEANVFESKKRVKATQLAELEHKLTTRQLAQISVNNCLLAYYTNQDNVYTNEMTKLRNKYPSRLSLAVSVIGAAKLAHSGKKKEAIANLSEFARNNKEDSLPAILSALQIALEQGGDMSECIELLLMLDDAKKFQLGILSTVMVLCSNGTMPQNLKSVLIAAIQWHKKKKTPVEKLGVLCKRVAAYHLKNCDPRGAAEALQELRQLLPEDSAVLAQLISAYSQFDAETAKRLSADLPSATEILDKYDVEALVASVGSKYSKKTIAKASEEAAGATESNEDKKKTKKKKKRIILPKKMVEGARPDPERWLPKWQRQNLKRRKDKRHKDAQGVGKGTQGVSSEAADQFDITKNPSDNKGTGTTRPPPQWSKKNVNKNKRGKKKAK